jgi:hypothetical protein
MTKAFLMLLSCAAAVTGCNAQIATVLSSDDAGSTVPPDAAGAPADASSGDGATTAACAARGGVCLPAGTSAPPDRRPDADVPCEGTDICWVLVESGDSACTTDAECNEDPSVSSLRGECFHGTCVCQAPYHVQPSGKCAETPPPNCPASGGTCRQVPAECQATELAGSADMHLSCGDETPALCCVPTASCKASVDFVCCGASASPYEPSCVNGWKTCAGPGPWPRLRQEGCTP